MVSMASKLWRLGDGSLIKAWYDPWIRDNRRAYATSVILSGMENMMVSELIEENENEWKTDVIKEVFKERDVENILVMPIMDEMGVDN